MTIMAMPTLITRKIQITKKAQVPQGWPTSSYSGSCVWSFMPFTRPALTTITPLETDSTAPREVIIPVERPEVEAGFPGETPIGRLGAAGDMGATTMPLVTAPDAAREVVEVFGRAWLLEASWVTCLVATEEVDIMVTDGTTDLTTEAGAGVEVVEVEATLLEVLSEVSEVLRPQEEEFPVELEQPLASAVQGDVKLFLASGLASYILDIFRA